MSKKEKIDVKIGTKEEAAWTNIKEKAQQDLESMKRAIDINTWIIELAEQKIQDEQKRSSDSDNSD